MAMTVTRAAAASEEWATRSQRDREEEETRGEEKN